MKILFFNQTPMEENINLNGNMEKCWRVSISLMMVYNMNFQIGGIAP
jgi:hypothetical protein